MIERAGALFWASPGRCGEVYRRDADGSLHRLGTLVTAAITSHAACAERECAQARVVAR